MCCNNYKDIIQVATEGSFELNKMGLNAGTIRYTYDNENWAAWVDIVTGDDQPIFISPSGMNHFNYSR